MKISNRVSSVNLFFVKITKDNNTNRNKSNLFRQDEISCVVRYVGVYFHKTGKVFYWLSFSALLLTAIILGTSIYVRYNCKGLFLRHY